MHAWVSDAVALCEPDEVRWCDGSTEEYHRLCDLLVKSGRFERLSDERRPNSCLARSHPDDVARVEDRTLVEEPLRGTALLRTAMPDGYLDRDDDLRALAPHGPVPRGPSVLSP